MRLKRKNRRYRAICALYAQFWHIIGLKGVELMGLAYSTKNKRTGEDFTISSVNRKVGYEGINYKIDIQVSKGKLGLNPFKRKKVARLLFTDYCTFNLEEAHKSVVDIVANLSSLTGSELEDTMMKLGYNVVQTKMIGKTPFLLVFNNP